MAFAYSLASFSGLIQRIALSEYLFDHEKEERLKEQEKSVNRFAEDLKSWKEYPGLVDKPDLNAYHKTNNGGKVILTGMFGMAIGFLMSTIASRSKNTLLS